MSQLFSKKLSSSSSTSSMIESNQSLLQSGVLYCWGENYKSVPTFNSLVPNICYLDSGNNHSLALTETGELFGWGDNKLNQLTKQVGCSSGTNHGNYKPIVISNNITTPPLKIRSIACGGNFSAVILENGLLYNWGTLIDGGKSIETPTKVDLLKGVTMVSIGLNHVAVVADSPTTPEKKSVFTWGTNKRGQLGVVGDSITNAPRRVTLGSRALSVVCGDEFTCAIVEGNEVFVWGYNKSRQICSNNSDEIISIPVKPFLGRDIVELAAGKNYIAARSGVGMVCVWGSNDQVCRIGDGDKWLSFPSKIKQISASQSHILALSERNEIYSWGTNDHDQLGHPTSTSDGSSGGGGTKKTVTQLDGRNVISVYAWGKTSGAIVEQGQFKVEIAESMRRKENIGSPAPMFIRRLVNYIRGENSKSEGLFRLSGSMARCDDLERKLDCGDQFSMSKFEPYDAADIIKRYLKTLPEPLLLNTLCKQYEKEILKQSDNAQIQVLLLEWISKLPLENRQLLIYILSFLSEISTVQIIHQKQNAMSEKNLSLVFAPNLLTKGEIGNDEIIENMIKMLPTIMKVYPEMEDLIIIDQAQQCLRGSRISYIIDHWNRVTKERETANKSLFKPEIIKTIINSIVECTLEIKNQQSNNSNGNSNGGQSLLSSSLSSSRNNNNNNSNINSVNSSSSGSSIINSLSLSTNSLPNVNFLNGSRDSNVGGNGSGSGSSNGSSLSSSPNMSPTIINRAGYSLSFSGVAPTGNNSNNTSNGNISNLLNTSGGALSAALRSSVNSNSASPQPPPSINALTSNSSTSSPNLISILNGNNPSSSTSTPTLHSNSSSGNLNETTRLYERVLSLILSPVFPIGSIMKVLPSIFELEIKNDVFIRLLTTIKLVRTINSTLDENIQSQINAIKEISNFTQFIDRSSWLNQNIECIQSDLLYIDESIKYWKQLQPSIQLYAQQIQSYFKWWLELLEKQNNETEEKLFRCKKEFDKFETEKFKLEKQLNNLSSTTLETNDESILLKKQYDQWCLVNQIDVSSKKIEVSNQQLSRVNQDYQLIQSQTDQFKPHMLIVNDFVSVLLNSVSSYIDKLCSIKSNSLSLFPQYFNCYIELIFTHHHEIKQSPHHSITTLKSLAQSVSRQHHLLFIENVNQSKYQISLELETKFNSLKRNLVLS